jgi:hypothetical protein
VRFVRPVVKEIVGLFVADWVQSGVIVVIMALGWLVFRRVGAPALPLLVTLLAAQLVWFARAEARRLARPASGR